MAITKIDTLARILDIPSTSVSADTADSRILFAQGKTYIALSLKYDMSKACKEWVTRNAWRVPISFVLPFTKDEHHGFVGIKSPMLMERLAIVQAEIGPEFNELVLSVIQNKTAFVKAVVEHFGYPFVFGCVDDLVYEVNGFLIVRIA